MPDNKEENGVALKEREDTRSKKPRKYNVLVHNDDFTPMDFVVGLLVDIFKHTFPSAVTVMLSIHNKGVGVAGTYTHEIAETKMHQVHAAAKAAEWPLVASIEPVDGGEEG